MSTQKLQIITPTRRAHREAMIDLWSKVFGFGGTSHYFSGRDFCRDGYLDGSHYDWDASRIGLVDGQLVTHYGVWGYPMRVGGATLRCGGIGAVCTHPDFRKRGHLDATARASIDAMRDAGYDLSLLFGIDGFYDRFGYVRVFDYEKHHVATKDLPREAPKIALRKFKLARREDTDRLYNRAFAGFTGTAVRPTFTRGGDVTGDGYRWTDGGGKTKGYVYVTQREHTLRCYEGVGPADVVLGVLGKLARKLNCDSVEFDNQPRRSALMRAVRGGRCRVETWRNHNGGPMAKLLNLGSALEKCTDELHARVRGSAMSKWAGTLVIDDGDDKAALRITPRGVAVAEPGKSKHTVKTRGHAAQLLYGTDAPEILIADAKMKAAGDAAAVVAALFPAQDPGLLPFDHF